MKLKCGQSRAAFGMSVGLPISGVSTGEGEKPLWMQMLKKPGCFSSCSLWRVISSYVGYTTFSSSRRQRRIGLAGSSSALAANAML